MKRKIITGLTVIFFIACLLWTIPAEAAETFNKNGVIDEIPEAAAGGFDVSDYSGYYMNKSGKMYKVSKGVTTLFTGTLAKGKSYYSDSAGKKVTMTKSKVFVKGKTYTGYYKGRSDKIYKVKKGVYTRFTGTLAKGKSYYGYNAGKKITLSKNKIFVKGEAYTGYYKGQSKKIYKVKNGVYAPFSGTLTKGKKYAKYGSGKTASISRTTIYVKGKVYTGYYMNKAGKMYNVKNGTGTLVSGALGKGTKYYSMKTGKTLKLPSITLYSEGKQTGEKMSKAERETLERAYVFVHKITHDGMTKEQKLKRAWDFVKKYPESRPRTPHYKGLDWPVIYANDIYLKGTGNCFSYASALAYMAKVIGYEEVYCCNSGGHGWVEIDGLIYDPEWSNHHFVYNYYGLSYNTKVDQNYKAAISAGYAWMHVKICQ